MSARTDLCGGYQATGIPTATQSQKRRDDCFAVITSLVAIGFVKSDSEWKLTTRVL
jgi:hypothetical protein